MAIALVVKGTAQSTNGNGFTTGAYNSTGADLHVVVMSSVAAGATLSDSLTLTWNPLTIRASTHGVRIWWAVGAGGAAQTHTVIGASTFSSIARYAFSGGHASPFDQESGATDFSVTSKQPGSLTPSVDGCVLVAGAAYDHADALSINGGFSTPDQLPVSGGAAYGAAGSYLIQTTAASANPAWSWSPAHDVEVAMAVFKPAAGAATAAITGTGGGGMTEADVIAGGKTIIMTVTGDTFISS